MDPDFRKALVIVLVVGFGIAAVGATLLFIAFRALRGEKPGKHIAFAVATLAFVLVSCIGLFIWSYR
jgi:hypothetical protein